MRLKLLNSQSIMIDWEAIRTTSDKKWLKSLITEGVPMEGLPEEGIPGGVINIPMVVRAAAQRLYELGETDYAFEVLITQMNQYKELNISQNTKYETCPQTMIALGQLGERRAIEHLIEATDEFTDTPAFALSLINGTDLEARLLELSKTEGIRRFGAKLSLGFMKNKEVLPQLIEILEKADEYHQKFHGKIMWLLRDDIMYMLGNYDDETAQKVFVDNLKKSDIEHFVRDYGAVERRFSYYKYTDLATLGWRISKKYGWDKHIDTEDKKFAFRSISITCWNTYYTTPCPFKSDLEIEKLREEIIEEIWQEMKSNE